MNDAIEQIGQAGETLQRVKEQIARRIVGQNEVVDMALNVILSGGHALIVGVPLGVVTGRWSWIALAERFGTIPEPVVQPLGTLAVVTLVVVLSATIGIIPVQQGLRRRPGEVLRSE